MAPTHHIHIIEAPQSAFPSAGRPSSFFDGPRAKIRRAKKHLTELETELANLTTTKPIRFLQPEITYELNGNTSVIQPVQADPIPEDISTITGDVIHNLRSALDLTACDLVRIAGKSAKGVHFPFCKDSSLLEKMIKDKKFHRAGKKAVDLLISIRPYRNGNDDLWAIHELDLQDKHEALIPKQIATRFPTYGFAPDSSGVPRFALQGDLDTSDSIQYVFPGGSPLEGRPVIQTLQELMELTNRIIDAFAAL